MSDDTKKDEKKKDDKKKDDKDAKAAAGEAKPGKLGGLVPIIAGVVVLAGIGGGAGMYFAKSLTPAATEKPGEGHAATTAEGHGETAAEGHGEGTPTDGHGGTGLLAVGQELDPIDLKGNITGSGGTRYLTMQVGIWVPKKDVTKLNDPSVKRLIQARLEETLKGYQLEDLQSPNISARMKKDFITAVERLLRSLIPDRAATEKFVLEISVTNQLTQ